MKNHTKKKTKRVKKAPGTQIAVRSANPLDLQPQQFSGGLAVRKANRDSLMTWIRSALVEGIDFGRLHVVKIDKCKSGGPVGGCTHAMNPGHWSKPSLWKPGAEKICGMLGLNPTFPALKDYEAAALKGDAIKNIILRCELADGSGKIVASGVGARSTSRDYDDLNKSLKMAEKSAQIDATLRCAGLSEVFTQEFDEAGERYDAGEKPVDAEFSEAPKTGADKMRAAVGIKDTPPSECDAIIAKIRAAGDKAVLKPLREQALAVVGPGRDLVVKAYNERNHALKGA